MVYLLCMDTKRHTTNGKQDAMTTPTITAAAKAKTTTKRKTAKRKGTVIHKTREAWLCAAAALMRPLFAKAQQTIRATNTDRYPDTKTTLPRSLRITCGWPSHRGTSARGRVIGQCWNPKVSGDQTTEIFISPYMEDTVRVLGVLAHELIHAAIGTKEGHGHLFVQCMKALDLVGKPTATTEGEDFTKWCNEVALPALGQYKHKRMNVSDFDVADKPKKQGTRMIKVACGCCGYTVRTTQKWVDVAIPTCPNMDCDDHGEEMEAHAPKTPKTGRPK